MGSHGSYFLHDILCFIFPFQYHQNRLKPHEAMGFYLRNLTAYLFIINESLTL